MSIAEACILSGIVGACYGSLITMVIFSIWEWMDDRQTKKENRK